MILQSEVLADEMGVEARTVIPLEFEDIDEHREGEAAEEPIPAEETTWVDPLAELEQRLRLQTETNEQQVEKARQQARVEMRSELESEFEERLARERELIAAAAKRFNDERTRYFTQVEGEVVRLALAVAARVLHREVSLDPLLLRGAVRVALEQLHENSTAALRVPESQVDAWDRIRTENQLKITVEGDPGIEEGDCVLETGVGRVELGIKAQMEEIEKGFFDLLQQRPA